MNAGAAPVLRHRTAMARHSLSQPMSLMVQHGIVRQGVSIFDFGCGQGDDLRALAAAGHDAAGWDPHFAPANPKQEADVVNLGFVLNVIENADERRAALREAWSLTRNVLAVSTMILGQVRTEGLRPYQDGFLTSRGTFQKYFSQSELAALVAEATGAELAAAAPGIFFAFRHAEDLEEYLLRRRMRRRASTAAYRVQRERRAGTSAPDLAERLAPALADLAHLVQLRGRMPAAEEVPVESMELLARNHVALPRALDLAVSTHLDADRIAASAASMREDLLVHFALARLNRRAGAERPVGAMARDIRAHFGSQRELVQAATDYLMGLGDNEAVAAALREAAAAGLGVIDQKGRLLFDAQRSEYLPAMLRVYLGCAAYLAGEPVDQSLVRIDAVRRLVAYLPLEDPKAAAPIAASMIQIDLKRQSMSSEPTRRQLLARSRIIGRSSRAQREAEADRRAGLGVADNVLMIRIA